MEGLIFGGAYVQREICVSKSTGLAIFLERNLPLFFVLLCATGQFPSTSPPGGGGGGGFVGGGGCGGGGRGGLFLEGRFYGRFFALRVWGGLYLEGLIHG